MNLSKLFYGKVVRLTAVNPEDIPTITQWYQYSDLPRLFDATPAYPRSEAQWSKWLEQQEADKDTYLFGIRLLESNPLVGIVDISGISWTNGSGWIGIAVGNPANQGKGYGHEAMQLVLEFAFLELNLHRVQLSVFEYNTPAIRLYEKLGFTREGVQREFLQRDGRRYDMILFGLLRHEWQAQRADQAK